MQLLFTKVFVNDQDNALKFYTGILGFKKKNDVSNGPYRWLTVIPAGAQNSIELVLELNSNPAAKAYQEAIFQQNMTAIMLGVEDVQAEYERLKGLGVKFTMEPTEIMPHVTIAIFDDTCGNLVQIQKITW